MLPATIKKEVEKRLLLGEIINSILDKHCEFKKGARTPRMALIKLISEKTGIGISNPFIQVIRHFLKKRGVDFIINTGKLYYRGLEIKNHVD